VFKELVEFINVIDFQQIDSNLFPKIRCDITTVDASQDDQAYGIADGQEGYMYHSDTKRLVEMKQGDPVSGSCVCIEITKYPILFYLTPLTHRF